MTELKKTRETSYRAVRWSALLLVAALPGCGAAPEGDSAQEPAAQQEIATQKVGSVAQDLDPFQCSANLFTCIGAAKTFTDLGTCNQTYASCLVAPVVPPVVTTTVNALNACQTTFTTCSGAAKSVGAVATCQVQEVTCAGQALAAPVTTAVAGAAECVDASATCVGKAKTAADIAACGQTFTTCVGQAVVAPVLPPAVTQAVTAVTECNDTVSSCVTAAKTPADLTTCTTTNVLCIAGALGVPVTDATAAVTCADDAGKCVLAAKSVDDLNACSTSFAACGKELAPQSPLNCDVAFTQCVAQNPFNFFQCADTARQCHLAATPS